MKISVAMATYNGERYLGEQLASLAAQTRPPDELVIMDDGSTDQTQKIVEEFARHARFPVRFDRNESNLGYTRNFLRAARRCTGSWIAFCDQDDIWLPEKLARVECHMTDPTVLLIAHSAELVDERSIPTGIRYPDFRRLRVLDRRALPTWWIVEGFVSVFRATLMPYLADHEGRLIGDWPTVPHGHDALVCRLARALGGVVVLPDRLALHRWHSSAVTTGVMPHEIAGIRASRTFLSRFRQILRRYNSAAYRRQSEEALHQALVYRQFAVTDDGERMRRRWRSAEREYRAFSEWIARRADLYETVGLGARFAHGCGLISRGGYFRFNGCSIIGMRSLTKELALDGTVMLLGAERVGEPRID